MQDRHLEDMTQLDFDVTFKTPPYKYGGSQSGDQHHERVTVVIKVRVRVRETIMVNPNP